MKQFAAIILFFTFLISCKQNKNQTQETDFLSPKNDSITYAKGFVIQNHKNYKRITCTASYPNAPSFDYILYQKGKTRPQVNYNATFIEVPISRVVATSTSDIPMLEYLNAEDKLVGFPHTEYISSQKTRQLIEKGNIQELGNHGELNTELTLDLDPDLIIGYAATGDTKNYNFIKNAGIPVVMNGSWMEQHPLGRAEWIKFIAAFLNKEKEAQIIFSTIEKKYLNALNQAKLSKKTPTILSGSMYKDIWYVPGGRSYLATFFKHANTNYIWANTDQSGSIVLNFESVLEKAQRADIWIGSMNATSLSSLKMENDAYRLFDAFKNKAVYSSSIKTGTTGGILYYELGSIRPDLILKDIIKIAHPNAINNHKQHFFEKLN